MYFSHYESFRVAKERFKHIEIELVRTDGKVFVSSAIPMEGLEDVLTDLYQLEETKQGFSIWSYHNSFDDAHIRYVPYEQISTINIRFR